MKIYDFPAVAIAKQIFYVPGGALDGGLTTGGAQMRSPEPGGFGVLEIQPSYRVGEWTFPLASWLMSKTNGEYIRIRLAPTPQIASSKWRAIEGVGPNTVLWNNGQPWNNDQPWSGDTVLTAGASALAGSNTITLDMGGYGQILQIGHVIGVGNTTHTIDDIVYDNDTADIVVKPPFRTSVNMSDIIQLRPYFVGVIVNGGDIRETYDAENVGNIQIPKITLSEVIL